MIVATKCGSTLQQISHTSVFREGNVELKKHSVRGTSDAENTLLRRGVRVERFNKSGQTGRSQVQKITAQQCAEKHLQISNSLTISLVFEIKMGPTLYYTGMSNIQPQRLVETEIYCTEFSCIL